MKTSNERYHVRIQRFIDSGSKHPKLSHHFFWLLHNCVAHPILGFYVSQSAIEFHQITSNWLNSRPINQNLSFIIWPMMNDNQKRWWAIHNFIAHFLIGLFPCSWTFKFHDWTAEKMDIQGWV